jgi:rifampin ADP-ribosylating transferase
MVKPGGWVVVGEPYWLQEPSEYYLEASGLARDDVGSHASNAESGEQRGLDLVHTIVSSHDDWDRYEGLQWYATDEYARSHPDDSDLAEVVARVGEARAAYLRWGRDTLGWAIYVFRLRPVPFLVSAPCAACKGEGRTNEQVCPACHGTGVERFYHGTKAQLKPGDLIEPGRRANIGEPGRVANYVYMSGTLDAATWGAELAQGEGRGRIYVVEPTSPIEDDPNLTDKRYPGNPTKSYRSREPLRVTGEVADWRGHSPQELKAMKDGLERLEREGAMVIDD